MKFRKLTMRQLISTIITVLIVILLFAYKLPYYVYKPGGADALDSIVKVDDGYTSEGQMHLVTVRGGQATPIQYLLAKFLPHQDIVPIEDIRPEGITEDEYFHAQLQMMESSQEASTVVAYEAANANVNIDYEGVYIVGVLEGLPADGILEMGDRITSIDNQKIEQADDLMDYIKTKQAGDTITIHLEREDEQLTKEITVEELEELDGEVGLGITLVTDRKVTVDPEVHFSSGNIGGPSAGLMFSLEIYDQLTEEDLTKGYQIAGSGEIDYEGNVIRIGSVDKKVIAADQEDCDIFFAANENGAHDSNYEQAVKTAEKIGTNMEIVPVDTFDEALAYLQTLSK